MKIAIMIPMTDHCARNLILRPKDWQNVDIQYTWPEIRICDGHHIPSFSNEIANEVQAVIEQAENNHYSTMVIITRAEIAIMRVRRMVAEGAKFDVTIHFPGLNDEIATIKNDGEIDKWPEGLFSEVFREVKAIRRVQRKFEIQSQVK